MKKVSILVSALAFGFLAGPMKVHAAHKPKTMKYEVVDLSCYETKGAHGPKHKECAIKCINGGAELGLLRGGVVYIPVDKDFHSARDQFVPKAGEMVEVEGKVFHRGGVHFLQVASSMDDAK